jgi:hypothetical protein
MLPPSLPSPLSRPPRQASEKRAELLLPSGSLSAQSNPSRQESEKRAELVLKSGSPSALLLPPSLPSALSRSPR